LKGTDMVTTLPPERMRAALAAISGWRLDPDAPVNCPVCGAEGLAIIDQSARPYAEWYALSCTACGLNHSLHIPLAPPTPGGMD
jgi:hypothetical protein